MNKTIMNCPRYPLTYQATDPLQTPREHVLHSVWNSCTRRDPNPLTTNPRLNGYNARPAEGLVMTGSNVSWGVHARTPGRQPPLKKDSEAAVNSKPCIFPRHSTHDTHDEIHRHTHTQSLTLAQAHTSAHKRLHSKHHPPISHTHAQTHVRMHTQYHHWQVTWWATHIWLMILSRKNFDCQLVMNSSAIPAIFQGTTFGITRPRASGGSTRRVWRGSKMADSEGGEDSLFHKTPLACRESLHRDRRNVLFLSKQRTPSQ